jgi:hypothetical protein
MTKKPKKTYKAKSSLRVELDRVVLIFYNKFGLEKQSFPFLILIQAGFFIHPTVFFFKERRIGS